MPDTKKLSNMLDDLINNNAEQAQVNFHDYLQDKMQDVQSDQEPVPVQSDEESND